MFKEEYELDYFKKKGFVRKQCSECGEYFWTLDKEMKTCQDTPCTDFEFIGDPPTSRAQTVPEMRKYFLDFFSERGHTPLERYPVVARWRDDVFLVHASIYDFQPHVTSGLVDPPANPLAISQPCIRMPDLDEVGRTGKHMTCFEMMGHHAFNSKERYVYWKDETVEYCHEMLRSLGVDEMEIAYKEHPWIGGGNAGPSVEVNVRGIEIATLVFMDLEEDPKGDIELEGERYSPLELNVVDTGYGLERWVWLSDGAPTIYDSVYPDIVAKICDGSGLVHPLDDEGYKKMLGEYTKIAGRFKEGYKDERVMSSLMNYVAQIELGWGEDRIAEQLDKLKSVYTVADHCKTIAFMLSDGVVPSNVAEGYLARLMIRRTLRHLEYLESSLSIKDIVREHMDKYNDLIDTSKKDRVFDMLDSEIEGYRETMERGKRLFKRNVGRYKDKKIPVEDMIELYDTHGIHPTVVRQMGLELGLEVDIPEDFNTMLAKLHEKPAKEGKVEGGIDLGVVDTELLYYREPESREFTAKVLLSKDGDVILDRTLFYPEGGGQVSDAGVLETELQEYEVEEVSIEGGVVIHRIKGDIPVGKTVKGKVDWSRRMDITRHHTATHIVMSSAREVLGDHVWQRGAQKTAEGGRLDISHYKRISRDELKEIERRANLAVLKDIPVNKEELTRDEAEERFGFQLYQGGVPSSDIIKVVHICGEEDIDAQACGGTHVKSTADVGAIKITGTQRIQDGVIRLTYTAGMRTVEHVQNMEDILIESADTFNVSVVDLTDTAQRFFNEWKERGKELDKLKDYRSMALSDELMKSVEEIDGVEMLSLIEEGVDVKELLGAAERVTRKEKRVVVTGTTGTNSAHLVFARSEDVDIDMREILREAAVKIGGGGGGTPSMAQGGGKRPEGIRDALELAMKLIRDRLR